MIINLVGAVGQPYCERRDGRTNYVLWATLANHTVIAVIGRPHYVLWAPLANPSCGRRWLTAPSPVGALAAGFTEVSPFRLNHSSVGARWLASASPMGAVG